MSSNLLDIITDLGTRSRDHRSLPKDKIDPFFHQRQTHNFIASNSTFFKKSKGKVVI